MPMLDIHVDLSQFLPLSASASSHSKYTASKTFIKVKESQTIKTTAKLQGSTFSPTNPSLKHPPSSRLSIKHKASQLHFVNSIPSHHIRTPSCASTPPPNTPPARTSGPSPSSPTASTPATARTSTTRSPAALPSRLQPSSAPTHAPSSTGSACRLRCARTRVQRASTPTQRAEREEAAR